MKKKRFLKLVMSYGIQRDKAARWWVKTPNPNYSKPQAEERQG